MTSFVIDRDLSLSLARRPTGDTLKWQGDNGKLTRNSAARRVLFSTVSLATMTPRGSLGRHFRRKALSRCLGRVRVHAAPFISARARDDVRRHPRRSGRSSVCACRWRVREPAYRPSAGRARQLKYARQNRRRAASSSWGPRRAVATSFVSRTPAQRRARQPLFFPNDITTFAPTHRYIPARQQSGGDSAK